MIGDSVDWLCGTTTIHPKLPMLMKWADLMPLRLRADGRITHKLGVPKKAREICESYWDCRRGLRKMSFAVYAQMFRMYLNFQALYLQNAQSRDSHGLR